MALCKSIGFKLKHKSLNTLKTYSLLNIICVIDFCFAGLFHAFDENRDNHIDFKEISCVLSACCRGPVAERQKCKPCCALKSLQMDK